jgi:hypothetical protein
MSLIDPNHSPEEVTMKYFFCLLVSLTLFLMVAGGCIPSAPPEKEPVKQSTAPAPEQVTPVAETPMEEIESAPAPSAAAEPKISSVPEITSIQIPFNEDAPPEGAILLPVISFVPLTEKQGFRLEGKFPVDGITMEGTVELTAPGTWRLSGTFQSDTELFAPTEPGVQIMGAAKRNEEGVPVFLGLDHTVMLFMSAPLPPADAPKLDSLKTIPYQFEFEAPENADFSMMLTPF